MLNVDEQHTDLDPWGRLVMEFGQGVIILR